MTALAYFRFCVTVWFASWRAVYIPGERHVTDRMRVDNILETRLVEALSARPGYDGVCLFIEVSMCA